jgi:molybdate transport system regulatory protein
MNNPSHKSALSTHGLLFPVADTERCLDTKQLQELEQSFRRWAQSSRQPGRRNSRYRILLIFLLIRYTGARLNEVLSLDPGKDFDLDNNTVYFCKRHGGKETTCREVQIPEKISEEIKVLIADPELQRADNSLLQIDPAHVRRKFYEQAGIVGIPRALGIPEGIRKSRAVELIQSNVPLPVVQKILGHSTPNLTASYVEFSDAEIHQVARYFVDRENLRKTSARNAFFGKINAIRKGDVQAIVEVVSVNGSIITSIITIDSLKRIGLRTGMLIKAEVKAPWVQLSKTVEAPKCSADNLFQGTVCRIIKGRISTEIVIRLFDDTELCAIITETSRRQLKIEEQDQLWAYFDAFAVVLHVD